MPKLKTVLWTALPIAAQVALLELFWASAQNDAWQWTGTPLRLLAMLNLMLLIAAARWVRERDHGTIQELVEQIRILNKHAGTPVSAAVLKKDEVVPVLVQAQVPNSAYWLYLIPDDEERPLRVIASNETNEQDQWPTTHLRVVDDPDGRRRLITMHINPYTVDRMEASLN
jgi:hypothetical protein